MLTFLQNIHKSWLLRKTATQYEFWLKSKSVDQTHYCSIAQVSSDLWTITLVNKEGMYPDDVYGQVYGSKILKLGRHRGNWKELYGTDLATNPKTQDEYSSLPLEDCVWNDPNTTVGGAWFVYRHPLETILQELRKFCKQHKLKIDRNFTQQDVLA